jgi:hypothetical protein
VQVTTQSPSPLTPNPPPPPSLSPSPPPQPIPVTFLALLNLRRPVFVRKAVLNAARAIMTMPFVGNVLSLVQFFLIIAIVSWVNTTADVYRCAANRTTSFVSPHHMRAALFLFFFPTLEADPQDLHD